MTTSCHTCKRADLPATPGTRYIPVAHVSYKDKVGIPCPGGPPPMIRASWQNSLWDWDDMWDLPGSPGEDYVWPELGDPTPDDRSLECLW